MLIYNFQKEFVGIDEKDLKGLGFKDLAGLRAEVHDFADLFVKTPGYIHNFKHVHWIDFITCAESNEESKVIINVNNKNYKAVVQISTTYLVDNPASKAFTVTLNNLRELSVKESENISGDIVEREAPVASKTPQPVFTSTEAVAQSEAEESFEAEEVNPNVTIDPYETPIEIDMEEEEEELPQEEVINKDKLEEDTFVDDVVDNFEAPLDIILDEDESTLEDDFVLEEKVTVETIQESFNNGYVYDPSVASDELGLPLDLIEEFIQDFIEQAKEFKDDLYQAIDEGDLDNLKILSHKLKGVAANLRIEDALEALSVANTSNDINIIRENLDTLYKIVAKLANEEISVEKEIVTPEVVAEEPVLVVEEEENLKLDLNFKDDDEDLYSDPLEINDTEVPHKIELPELADDTFVSQEAPMQEDEPLDLLDIDTFEDDLTTPELSLAPEVEIEDIQISSEYSKSDAAADIGLDIESFEELFSDYISESQALTSQIKSAISENDFAKCKNEALKLKGMSDNMRIISFTSELETLMSSTDTTELENAVIKIDSAVSQLATKEV